MKTKMTMGDAHTLLSTLIRMDNDASLKLKNKTHQNIAINITRLMKDVGAYEKERDKIVKELREEAESNKKPFDEVTMRGRDNELRDEEDTYDLRMLTLDDLEPKKGEHVITGLATLHPIISDFFSGEGDDKGGDSE